MSKHYDVVIVGAGMAGLTAAAYASKAGLQVLVLEKNKEVGGLVNTFKKQGFHFDGGIRAFENAGIVLPMFKELGISLETVANPVAIGLEKDFIYLQNKNSLLEYSDLLLKKFPNESKAITKIMQSIQQVMGYMDVLYGIDNPLFMGEKPDRMYVLKTLLPWFIQYKIKIKKIQKLVEPVDVYLKKITKNQALIDMIIQHFFKNTPTFFALSYFRLYLSYYYPKKGMGELTSLLQTYILQKQGTIQMGEKVWKIDVVNQTVQTKSDNFSYRYLIWCADMESLYKKIQLEAISDAKLKKDILEKRQKISKSQPSESVLSLYYGLDLPMEFFTNKGGPHLFYTPKLTGLSSPILGKWQPIVTANLDVEHEKFELKRWLKHYFSFTTYEISCPVLRNTYLAPSNKTGLIVSTLFDYELTKHIEKRGWYEEFKVFVKKEISIILEKNLYPTLQAKTLFVNCATPKTIASITASKGGSIVGWQYNADQTPAVFEFAKVTKSIQTLLPNVYQAGQWTFAPAGLPICILTGKLATMEIVKKIAKEKKKKAT